MFVERHSGSAKVNAARTRMNKELDYLTGIEVLNGEGFMKPGVAFPPAVQVFLSKDPKTNVAFIRNGEAIPLETVSKSFDVLKDCRRNLKNWGIDID